MASKQAEENQILLAEYRAEKNPRRKSRLEGQLVQKNLPFVKNKAHKFMNKSHVALELEDLLQAGMIGLLHAIRKDKSKSAFTTYANWWIFHEFQSLATKTQQVKRPKGAGLPYRAFRAMEAVKAATGVDATDEDLGVPDGTIEEWRQSPVFYQLDDEDGNYTPSDEKMASNDTPQDELFDDLEGKSLLGPALDCLSPDERAVIEKQYFEEGVLTGSECVILFDAMVKLRDFLV